MQKKLSPEQQNIALALQELVKQPGRDILKEYITSNIQYREDILLGKQTVPINLDEIKFSQNGILRGELAILYNILQYPETYTKGKGVYN